MLREKSECLCWPIWMKGTTRLLSAGITACQFIFKQAHCSLYWNLPDEKDFEYGDRYTHAWLVFRPYKIL